MTNIQIVLLLFAVILLMQHFRISLQNKAIREMSKNLLETKLENIVVFNNLKKKIEEL